MLDLGGLRESKRGQFDIRNYPVQCVCVNLSRARGPHVQADGAALPLRAGSFDAVVCAEVLEHVLYPDAILREAHRVLRNGGVLLATAPFLYRVHDDPHDYGRYTPEYWRVVLATAGFKSIEIQQHGRFLSVLADFAKQWVSEGGAPRPLGRVAAWGATLFASWALACDSQTTGEHPFSDSFATGYGIVAVKDAISR